MAYLIRGEMMSIILAALKNKDLREEKSNIQVIDDWEVGQISPVVSEHSDSMSLGPMSFHVETWTTLYLVLARRIKTTDIRDALKTEHMMHDASKSIHHDVYGELINDLHRVMYDMEYSGKSESKKALSVVIEKWSM